MTGVKDVSVGSISPPSGTPVGRTDPVAIQLVPTDRSGPPAFQPCDWVSTAEAAKFMGSPSESVQVEVGGEEAGSITPKCMYDAEHRIVISELQLPGSFAVDAQTEFNMTVAMIVAQGNGSYLSGLPGPAYCGIEKNLNKVGTTTLEVLLDGARLYSATGFDGQSCDTLKQFAQTAIQRIGA